MPFRNLLVHCVLILVFTTSSMIIPFDKRVLDLFHVFLRVKSPWIWLVVWSCLQEIEIQPAHRTNTVYIFEPHKFETPVRSLYLILDLDKLVKVLFSFLNGQGNYCKSVSSSD